MPQINLGRVGFVNKGAYIGGTTAYKVNDVVKYNNSVYVCTQAHNTEHLPTDNGYWDIWIDSALLDLEGLSNVDTAGKVAGDFLKWDGTNWVDSQLPKTTSPVVTIANTVNENATVSGTYTSGPSTVVTITAISGTILNHDTVAKTFDYKAYDITNGVDGTDTISAYATKAGELKSNAAITNITVSYVPTSADTTIQVLDIYNDLETNTGFIGV